MNNSKPRLTAWIACFAVLLATLAPSISHALSAAQASNAGWAEICTFTGIKMVKVEHPEHHDSSAPTEMGLHFEHCPFCFTHGGSVGLLPTAGFLIPAASRDEALPPLYYHAPRPLFIWAAAQSRAPPSIS